MAAIINSDTAVWRGVRTGLQALAGIVLGLIGVVWAVPGVPEAVTTYLRENLLSMALGGGALGGVFGFIWNALRKDVKTT